MSVQPALFKILIRATKSFAKRALTVPSALVAVPATVNNFSAAILCCLSKFDLKFVAYLLYMPDFLAYTYIIAELSFLVNHNISFWMPRLQGRTSHFFLGPFSTLLDVFAHARHSTTRCE
jgi:hypothetical protein